MKKNIFELYNLFKQIGYYNGEEALKTQANIFMIWSGKNAGKSFFYKNILLTDAYELNYKFVLVFRFQKGKKTKKTKENYFKDEALDIKKITNGKYSKVFFRGDNYYYGNINPKTKKEEYGELIGHIAYVDCYDDYSSQVFEGVYNVLFEEFMTGDGYLYDEVYNFEIMLNSILRDRANKAKIIMLANPKSRICPYITEWNLPFMKTMKPGEIITVERNKKLITVERVKDVERKDKGRTAISRKGQQIEAGEWETGNFPLLPGWQKYDEVYNFVFIYKGVAFQIHCMADDEDLFLYIHNKTKDIKKDERVIGDINSTSILYTKGFTPLNHNEAKIFELLRTNKIFFSNELTAADFYNSLETMRMEM